jgi:hypothetical protein
MATIRQADPQCPIINPVPAALWQPPPAKLGPQTDGQLAADYGSAIVDNKALAKLRGEGVYNPPPTWLQTTNRGNAMQESYNLYKSTSGIPLPQMPNPEGIMNLKEPFQVGSTGLYQQPPNSWNRPNAEAAGCENGVCGPNASDQYQIWAQETTNMTPNTLMNVFFSKTNVDFIQNSIIENTARITAQNSELMKSQGKPVEIARQSDDELLIIMRSYYLKALSGYLPHSDVAWDEDNPGKPPNTDPLLCSAGKVAGTTSDPNNGRGEIYNIGPTGCSINNKLARLNKAVISLAVKQVLSGIDMYLEYYKQASTLPVPLSHPTLTTMKGSRVLSEDVGFSSGLPATRAADSYNMRYNII